MTKCRVRVRRPVGCGRGHKQSKQVPGGGNLVGDVAAAGGDLGPCKVVAMAIVG